MILVAGIGNIFLGDDAFGSETARHAQHLSSDDVRVVDFGFRGLDLAFALMDGYEAVILIGAISRGGEPGTIYVIEPDLTELDYAVAPMDGHSMDPVRVLALARSMGARLKNVRLVGCEPESFEESSPRVMAAVESAVAMIEELVREHEGTKDTKALEGAA
jgi:hydrogenase maturation protease